MRMSCRVVAAGFLPQTNSKAEPQAARQTVVSTIVMTVELQQQRTDQPEAERPLNQPPGNHICLAETLLKVHDITRNNTSNYGHRRRIRSAPSAKSEMPSRFREISEPQRSGVGRKSAGSPPASPQANAADRRCDASGGIRCAIPPCAKHPPLLSAMPRTMHPPRAPRRSPCGSARD